MTGVGQIAHIKGAKPKAPRYDAKQTPEERHGYQNLIAACLVHGVHIDDEEKVSTYTVEVLQRYKAEHEKKVEERADRNWIMPPNTITGGSMGGTTVHFWIDRDGKQRVYSDEQLAKCNALLELNLDISNLRSLMDAFHAIDEPIVKSLLAQSYAKVGEDADNLYAHIAQIMAAVPEVTFGEFLRFIVEGNDVTDLVALGEQRIKETVDGKRKAFWRNC